MSADAAVTFRRIASVDGARRYVVTDARVGGHNLGTVVCGYGDWRAFDPDGGLVWDEGTGENWPTRSDAGQALLRAREARR